MCLWPYMMEMWKMCTERAHGLLGTESTFSSLSNYPLTPKSRELKHQNAVEGLSVDVCVRRKEIENNDPTFL